MSWFSLCVLSSNFNPDSSDDVFDNCYTNYMESTRWTKDHLVLVCSADSEKHLVLLLGNPELLSERPF